VTVEVPSDSARTRRIALAVIGIILGTALLGIGVWAATRPPVQSGKQTAIEPAEETTEPTGSLPATNTGSTEATGSPGATPTPPPAGTPPAGAAARRIAFTLGGSIYVAAEDGSGAVSVAPQGVVHSLSPDGSTLAVVHDVVSGVGEPGTVALYDTTTGAVRWVGSDAVAVEPSWSPDSNWFAYTAQSGRFRVDKVLVADGSTRTIAEPGASPQVSADGSYVAFVKSDQPGLGDPLQVVSSSGGALVAVRGGGSALAWAWGPSGTLYFTRAGDTETSWELWQASAPSFKGKRVGAVNLEAPAFALDHIVVSPDGSRVVLSAMGDDAYSRLWLVDAKTGRFSTISTRRDAYPYRWTTDGRIMYFEGNAYQGESGVLASVLPDGTSRRLIVTGAQR